MALVYDMVGVLRQMKKARENQPFGVVKNSLVEDMYNPSPINFEDYLRFELEKTSFNSFDDTAAPRQSSRINPNGENAAKAPLAIHLFEENKKSTFKFENTLQKPDPVESELTRLIKTAPAPRPSIDAHGSVRTLAIKIWFPARDYIKLTVGDKTLVEEVIRLAMQQYEMECHDKKKQSKLKGNAKAYVLRFSEDDGSADEDLPALVRSQEIGQFKGCNEFALCLDTSFKEKYNSKVGSPEPPVPLFKVYLPNEEGFVSVTQHMETTLAQVLDSVCKKRALNAELYEFEFFDSTDAIKGGTLVMTKTLGELGLNRLRLVEKGNKNRKPSDVSVSKNMLAKLRKSASIQDLGGDASKPITKRLGPMFFFTPQTAVKYHEYTVIKVNKFGVKQERIMGIDDKQISNSIPDGKVKSANDKVKRPKRELKEVQKVYQTKPNEFFLKYKDQTYRYESNQAEEIVAKITYLLQMNNLNQMDDETNKPRRFSMGRN